MQVKLFSNLTSIPFQSRINIMGDKLHSQTFPSNRWFLTLFIELIIDRELNAINALQLKFCLKWIIFRILRQST